MNVNRGHANILYFSKYTKLIFKQNYIKVEQLKSQAKLIKNGKGEATERSQNAGTFHIPSRI